MKEQKREIPFRTLARLYEIENYKFFSQKKQLPKFS